MYKEFAETLCMPSSKNYHQSYFMDNMANYGAMSNSQKQPHIIFDIFEAATTE